MAAVLSRPEWVNVPACVLAIKSINKYRAESKGIRNKFMSIIVLSGVLFFFIKVYANWEY